MLFGRFPLHASAESSHHNTAVVHALKSRGKHSVQEQVDLLSFWYVQMSVCCGKCQTGFFAANTGHKQSLTPQQSTHVFCCAISSSVRITYTVLAMMHCDV